MTLLNLYDFTREELRARFEREGFSPVHAEKLWNYLYLQLANSISAEAMPELPRKVITWLATHASLGVLPTALESDSTDGFTRKYLLTLADHEKIETVLMRFTGRVTACISSQVGCAMGCVFCATGQMGYTRHLTPGEIVAQAVHVARALRSLHTLHPTPPQCHLIRDKPSGAPSGEDATCHLISDNMSEGSARRRAATGTHTAAGAQPPGEVPRGAVPPGARTRAHAPALAITTASVPAPAPTSARERAEAAGRGERLRNVVLMGMGEPLHNYDAVMHAIDILRDDAGLSIAAERITLSTVGVVPGILRLAQEKRPLHLAVSLHAANQAERAALVPAAKKWPLDELMAACRTYSDTTGRRIFYEWTLIEGRNDSAAHARAVGTLLRGLPAQVNLIPLNPTSGYDGAATRSEAAKHFQRILAEEFKLPSTVRQRRGIDIAAGCGQLAVMDSA